MATDLADQGAERADAVAQWLEDRGPDEVLDDVRDFARRRPGTFLGIAAVAGLVVGRLGRGLKDGPPEAGTSARSTTAGTTTGGAHREQPVADAGSTWTPVDELDTPPAGSPAVSAGTWPTSGGGLTS